LTWIGIIGSAITLYGNLGSVLDLADWAKELITHWHEFTQVVWGRVFGWFGIKVPKQLIPVISFTAFATMLVIGVNLSSRAKPRSGRSMKPRITRMPIKIGYYLIGLLLLFLIASTSQSGVPRWLDPSFLAFWAIG
jgi:hypothetical protein